MASINKKQKLKSEWINGPKRFRQSIKFFRKFVHLKRKKSVKLGTVPGNKFEVIRVGKRSPRYVGMCPLHKERHPSFAVYDLNGIGIFKCFGCGRSGDIFSFIMKHEGLNFAESVLWVLKQSKGRPVKQEHQLTLFKSKEKEAV